MLYWLAYYLTHIFGKIFFRVQYIGRENFPKEGAFLLASNHASYLDPPIVGAAIPRKAGFLARDTLFKNRFFAWCLRQLQSIPVKRDSGDFGALRQVLRRLKDGMPVVLFPEGTRLKDKRKKKVLPGIGFIAAKAQVPVVPVYIHGSDEALPPGAKCFRFRRITVTIGKPLQFSPTQDYEGIADQIITQIYALKPS